MIMSTGVGYLSLAGLIIKRCARAVDRSGSVTILQPGTATATVVRYVSQNVAGLDR